MKINLWGTGVQEIRWYAFIYVFFHGSYLSTFKKGEKEMYIFLTIQFECYLLLLHWIQERRERLGNSVFIYIILYNHKNYKQYYYLKKKIKYVKTKYPKLQR